MEEEKNKNKILIEIKRAFTSLFSQAEAPYHEQDKKNKFKKDNYFSDMYKKEHVRYMLSPDKDIKQDVRLNDIKSYLETLTKDNSDKIEDTKSLLELSPNLQQAGKLLVSTILSPDDLQTDSLRFIINHPNITDDTNQALSDLLTEHMCKYRKLNTLLPDWIYEAIMSSGAVPILTIPNSNNRILYQLTEDIKLVVKNQNNKEVFIRDDIYNSNLDNEDIDSLLKKNIFSVNNNSNSLILNNFKNIIQEDKNDSKFLKVLNQSITNEFTNEFTNKELKENKKMFNIENIKKIAKPILNKMSEDNNVIISDNFRVLEKSKKNVKKAMDRINKTFNDQFIGVDNSIYKVDNNTNLVKGDHPFLIILKSKNVIPITIPGSNEKAGYFVVTDENINPLFNDITNGANNTSDFSNTTHILKEVFSPNMTELNKLNNKQKQKYASTIFNIALKHMIETKLSDMGLNNININIYNNIASTIFQNFLHERKVRLIFVPENLITYFAFDYREDGTGKSKLEDGAKLLIAMKNTLLVSKVLETMENAMDSRTIEVDIPEGTTNIEEIMEDIRRVVNDKRNFKPNIHYSDIGKDIIDRHIKIIPKNIQGLEGLSETRMESSSTRSRGDVDNLIEELDKQVLAYLNVPYSSLNAVGENELATSILSNNLFLANIVKIIQNKIISLCSKLAQNELIYSEVIQRRILEILKGDAYITKQFFSKKKDDPDSVKDKYKTEEPDDKKSNNLFVGGVINIEDGIITGEKKELVDILYEIIENVTAFLPKPNLVIDKNRIDELDSFIDLCEKYMDKVISQELLPIEDDKLRNSLPAMKATAIRRLIKNFVATNGMANIMESDIDVFDQDESIDLYKRLRNITQGISDWKKKLDDATADTSSDSGGSRW
jgi:hypothetical protein